MKLFNELLNNYSNRCMNDLLCEHDIEDGVKNFLQGSENYYFIETNQIKEHSKKIHSILKTLTTQYGSDEYKFLDINQANIDLKEVSLPKLLVLIISQEENVEISTIRTIINTVIFCKSKIIIINRKINKFNQQILQLYDFSAHRLVVLKRNLEESSRDFLTASHGDNVLKKEITTFLKNSEWQYIISKSSKVTDRLLNIQEVLTGLPEDLNHTYANECVFLNWKDVRGFESEFLACALPKLVVLVCDENEPADLEVLKQLLLKHYKIGQKKIIFVTVNDKIRDYLSSNQTNFDEVREAALHGKQILNNISSKYLKDLPNETNQNFNISQFLLSRDRAYYVIETPYVLSTATALRRDIQDLPDSLKNQYSLKNYLFLYWEQVEILKNTFGLTLKFPNLLMLICQTYSPDTANHLLESLMFKLSVSNRKKLVFITEDTNLNESLKRIHVNIYRAIPPELKECCEVPCNSKKLKIDLHIPTLSRAAEDGQLDIVKLRIDKGSNINACAPGTSIRPIERAVIKGHFYVVLFMIRHGAEFNWDKRTNPLHRAALKGDINVATVLLENCATIEARNENEETALHLAIAKGHFEMVKALIGFDANLEAVDNQRKTPLHIAVEYNKNDITNFLLTLDANHNAKDNKDRTPLHIAVEKGNECIVKLLLEYGADVNCKTTEAGGYTTTPLHIAAKHGWDKIVELLLRNQANINSKTSNDETVFELGRQSGNPNVQTVLNRIAGNV
ncbi:uncharacterized protein [Euwallacea similis]|uniref:uncharacterized protein n=1 Tax=Euwallacea similis TaxID=1736056 RepID=UPI00344B8225